MKKLLLLLALLAAGVLHAQITFEKYHAEAERMLSVNQTYDGGYVSGTLNYLVVKLDKYGDLQWTKYIQNYNSMLHDVLSSRDSSVMVVTTWEGDKKDIYLHKLSNDGDLIWQKKYGTSEDDYGYFVRQTNDDGFIIIGTQLIKLDKNGNVVWQKPNPHLRGLSNDALITKTGNILVSQTGQLTCLSPAGDLLWNKSFKMGNYKAVVIGNNIYYSGGKFVYKLDFDGNTIISKAVSDYYVIAEADSNSFVIAAKDTMIKMNTDLETVWSKYIPNRTYPTAIMNTYDNGYFLSGVNGWVLKTDQNGNHKSLHVLSPKEDETVKPGKYTLKWNSYDVSILNIEYSTDYGLNWISLKNNVLNNDSLIWNVPSEYDDYILKISDAEHPEIKDYSGPFQVTWNNENEYIAVNQIKMWVGNNGMGSHDEIVDGAGFFWPGGEYGKIASIFNDGLVWGGLIDGKPNVNGNTYRHGLTPGKILNDGSADYRKQYKYKIWKINRYWDTYPAGDKKEQLKFNYAGWPAELGAPYFDINEDGIFTRGVDVPDFSGDEVLWFVSNDLDSTVCKFVYGSDPIGLEVQTTVYALNRGNDLDDVVFKKYKIINKGNKTVSNMFLSYWSDPDMGYANDDFVGVDTTLDLAYSYNGDNNDEFYGYGYNPPAVGYKILQGPVIASTNDSAYFNNKVIGGMKNLSSFAFHFYIGGSYLWADPALGSPTGAAEFYNQMSGKFYGGSDIVDPVNNKKTRFPLSGDPVTGTGWYEGPGWPGGEASGDRRMMMSSGPFNFAPKDTQEIAIAIIMARGSDYINSITELRRKAQVVQEYYNNRIITGTEKPQQIISKYELQQNYPNPFNPSTTISYSVPEMTNVELKVFDVLGKEVITLVNEERPAGSYQVNFNSENLSSGIYLYRMKAKDYIKTMKMIIIK